MRIAIGVHHFPPRFRGGAEQRALRTAQALQRRGHSVRVITVDDPYSGPESGVEWEDDIHEGVQVRRLRLNLNAAPDPFRFEYDNPWIGDHLRSWLQEVTPDLFHLFSGYILSGRALHVAHELAIPSVVSVTDYWFLCRKLTLLRNDGSISELPVDPQQCARCFAEETRRYQWPARIAPRVMDWYWSARKGAGDRFRARNEFLLGALGLADAIISPSHFVRDALVQAGVEDARIRFARQGSERPLSTANDKEPSNELRITYMGQIAPHKGVHVAVQALSLLPSRRIRLRVYGNADQFPDYVRRLHAMMEKDPRCEILPQYGKQDLGRILRESDVVVVPSMWYENSPNVLLEAFQHHTPVLATNLGGMAELVEHGHNGLLFAMGDATDLAQQIRRLMDEPGLLAQLAANAPALPSLEQEIDALEEVYDHANTARAAIGATGATLVRVRV